MIKPSEKPYFQTTGAVSADSEDYIIRSADEELVGLLKQGEYCNVFAPRQTGKTSLIKRAKALLLNAGCATAEVEVVGHIGTFGGVDSWYQGLLYRIAKELRLEVRVRDWWAACDAITPNQRLIQFFREEVIAKITKPVVIFVDEIDGTIGLDYTDDFFFAIRAMYNDRASDPAYKRITFCLAGVAAPNDLIPSKRGTPYNIGRMIELQDFDIERDDLSSFYRVVSKDSSTGETIIRAALLWTGGHPYLTRRVCKEFIEYQGALSDDMAVIVDRVFTNFDDLEDDDHFNQVQRLLLGRDVSDKLALFSLYRRILRGEEVRDEAIPAHTYLKLAGIVKRNKRGLLVVRNAIYQRIFNDEWAASLSESDAKREEVATFIVTADKDEETLRLVIDDHKAALDAYEKLRANPAFIGNADELLAEFFERHAKRAKQDKNHPEAFLRQLEAEAFLWQLEALGVSQTEQRTKSIVDLIGTEFSQRAMIARYWNPQSTVTGKISIVDISLDGSLMLTVENDRTARVLVARSRQIFCQPLDHKNVISAAALSPDGRIVVTGDANGLAWLWRTAYAPPHDKPGEKQKPLKLGQKESASKIGVVAFSPDGEIIITGSDDGTAQCWMTELGQAVGQLMKHNGAVIAVAFSPDGSKVLTSSANGTVQLWRAGTGQPLGQPMRHERLAGAITFSPDGHTVLTGSDDGVVQMWDADTGRQFGRQMRHDNWISSIAFSPDSRMALTGSADGTVRLWRADSGEPFGKPIQHPDAVKSVTFSPDGNTALSVTSSWVHAAQINGEGLQPLAHSFLLGVKVWGNKMHFEGAPASRIQLVIGSFTDSLRVVPLRFDRPGTELRKGVIASALKEWENIFGLKVNERKTQPRSATMADPTGRTFISYRRSRVDEIALLIAALHDRGVPTWQDINNLGAGQAEANLRMTLDDPLVSIGILWLTPDVADSDMIRKVELPLIMDRSLKSEEDFYAVLVTAGGLDYKEAAQLASGVVTRDLGEFNMLQLKGNPIQHDEAAMTARLVLRYRIEKLNHRLPLGAPLIITINTGTPAPFESGKALILDWTHRFTSGRKVLPGAWDDFLKPALSDVAVAIQTKATGREVEVTGLLSLPGGVALGCAFLEPLAIKISWRPRQASDQLWNIRVSRQPSGFVASDPQSDTLTGEDLAVLVSVDNNVSSAFTRSKLHLGVKFRAISEVINPGLAPGVTRHEINTPGEAADIAYVVRQAIITARNQYPEIRRTHLFMAVPVGLAMMIGQLMNTCGMIQTYEFNADNHDCPYQPAVLLNPTW